MSGGDVRRILAVHYRPEPRADGPSWLTFLAHMKDSLSSLDLFRCDGHLANVLGIGYWVLVVMDQYTRRIIGFGIQAGVVDGASLCRMFKQATRGAGLTKYLSSDHDPLYRFHQREANLRILGITETKTVPYVPWSHPFIERLIETFVVLNKTEPSAENIWTKHYSGQPPIFRTNSDSSRITSIDSVFTLA